MKRVLVTGGSGFVASHIIARLLTDGYEVRTTLRDLTRQSEIADMLKNSGIHNQNSLSYAKADLASDDGWASAVAGCDYVMHVASPFPQTIPEDEDELIVPARDGTLRVLRAARTANVRRVVVTSSFAAVGYGHTSYDRVFDETDWTDLNGAGLQPYIRSKVLAERAAWDYFTQEGKGLEMTVINPVGIFGPVLGRNISASIAYIKQILDGVRILPAISFATVDVRDLADLHLRAMIADSANGQRFIAASGDVVTLLDVARILKANISGSVLDMALPQLDLKSKGDIRKTTSMKAQSMLDWHPRPQNETFVDTAESLFRFGIVKRI